MLITTTLALLFFGFLVSAAENSDFDDLGKLMLLGFLAAVGVALAFTFVRMRLRDKRKAEASFISINSFRDSE